MGEGAEANDAALGKALRALLAAGAAGLAEDGAPAVLAEGLRLGLVRRA